MGRSPCCSKVGLQRGPWSSEEDTLLRNYIQRHGEGQWRSVPYKAGLLRCGKSCRLRWMNYLRPGIKRGNITADEEDLIIRLHSLLGNRWTLIAGRLPGRTDNEVKNHWNTHMLKKLKNSGIQPKIPKHSMKCLDPETQIAVEPETDKRSTKCPERETQNADDPETDKRSKKCPKKKTKSTVPDENAKSKQGRETRTLHIPKPIRLSSVRSRSNSLDSLLSATSSGDVSVNAEKFELRPLVELDHANHGGFDLVFDEYQDFFSTYDFPLHYSDTSSSVKMLEKVYDEYLQLL